MKNQNQQPLVRSLRVPALLTLALGATLVAHAAVQINNNKLVPIFKPLTAENKL